MKHRWKARVLSSRNLVRTKYFSVVEEKIVVDGRRFTYTYRPHGPVVHVVALTRSGDAVLVRQYRHPPRRVLLEIPAGAVDRGESTLAAARRELAEETGYTARRWVRLGGWHPAPSSSNMVTHYYLALDARRTRDQKLDDFEFIEVELVPFRRLCRVFARMKGVTVNTLLGVALAERYLPGPSRRRTFRGLQSGRRPRQP